jgi:beta-phosphoglucomutase-like phosphatase (HAD superfamily)
VARLDETLPAHELAAGWSARYEPDENVGRRELWEALQAYLVEGGLSLAQIDEIEAAARLKHRELDQLARPLPGAVESVARLTASGMALAIAADVPIGGAELGERLCAMGFCVESVAVCTSLDAGATMSQLDRFLAVAARLALSPGEVAIVAASPVELAGAKAAGLRAIAVGRCAPDCDAAFARLADLAAALGPVE